MESRMNNKRKRSIAGIISMLIILCMVICLEPTKVYAVEKYLGEMNSSDTIYRWVRVESVADIIGILEEYPEERKNIELRLLLIPAVSHGSDELPGYEEYYIVDDGADYLDDISLKDNPMIVHTADEFYSRGGFRTPYLEYMGMDSQDYTIKTFGEAVPTFRIFEAEGDEKRDDEENLIYELDERTDELLVCKTAYGYKSAKLIQQVWTEEDLDELNAETDTDIWAFGFAAAHDETNVGRSMENTVYRTEARKLLTIAGYSWYKGGYHYIADDVYETIYDYILVKDTYKSIGAFTYFSEIFFKTFIGIPQKTAIVENTTVVNANQTAIYDGVTYIKEGAVLQIGNGATVFMSGTCINHGVIEIQPGGTLVLQKGALIMALDPQNLDSTTSGTILVGTWDLTSPAPENKAVLVVREGARILDTFTKGEHSIDIAAYASVVNQGIILVDRDFRMLYGFSSHMKVSGPIYIAYTLKKNIPLVGYHSDMDMTAEEFAKKVTKEFENNIKTTNTNASYVTVGLPLELWHVNQKEYGMLDFDNKKGKIVQYWKDTETSTIKTW